ncbi:MAG: DegT/DnrJ/EryC1/StrS family aminotransferase [Elusimicrobiota bacterium]
MPRAEAYYSGALSLPMHAALTDADVRRVIKTVREGLSAHD